ncbi:MAG: ChbG/HpnK family deacetylase [Azospirillum sp.]|nr:ChbG/HpnK family deacetylase [Azospirillum sp.]
MSERPATGFVLGADDYGLSPGVSRAIVDLIERGRLSATGCMTVSPFWPEHATWLRPLAGQADIGLHLTLTDHTPLGAMPLTAPSGRLPPLAGLMRRALGGGLDGCEIRIQVARQIAAFIDVFGQPPDFIDGHHHVHQLPTVREAVVEALQALPGAYVRRCGEPVTAVLRRGIAVAKTLLISRLGEGLARLIERARIPSNSSFRGVYDFGERPAYGEVFEKFVDRVDAPRGGRSGGPLGGRALVMCHPALPDDVLAGLDPVVAARQVEYRYFRSDRFADLLARRQLAVTRFAAPAAGEARGYAGGR